MNKGEGKVLPYNKKLINVEEIMYSEKKSPFTNHHNNNWFREESSENAKPSGWKFSKKLNIYIVSC